MAIAGRKVYETIRSFLERQNLCLEEREESYCCRFTVRSGLHQAHISVFNSGRIVVGGKNASPKDELNKLNEAIESSTALLGQMPPFEIEKYPATILEKVPNCGAVIIAFISEASKWYKAEAFPPTAFMLGAASVKAMNLLIDRYAESLADESNKNKFKQKVHSKSISKKWDGFKSSYAGCQSKPTDPVLNQDFDTLLESMLQFCTIKRNEIGRPQIVPNLDKRGVPAELAFLFNTLSQSTILPAILNKTGLRCEHAEKPTRAKAYPLRSAVAV